MFKISTKIVFFTIYVFSISTLNAQTLHLWVGPDGGSWDTAANWSPANVPNVVSEVAVFHNFNGTVNNSTSKTIGGLSIVGCNLSIYQGTNNNRSITLNGQFASEPEFFVLNSTLKIFGRIGAANTLAIILSASNNGNVINSIIESTSPDGSNGSRGQLTNNAGASNLIFDASSIYLHTHNQGSIPVATWQTGSLVSITGITANSPAIGANQIFDNFTWNCPSNIGNRVLTNQITVLGTFLVESTGSGSLSLNNVNNSTRAHQINNFILNNGTLSLSLNGNPNTIGILQVSGTFTQNGGVISRIGGSTSSRIIINGSANQDITLVSQTGGNFEIDKPSGTAILMNSISLPANLLLTNGELSLGSNTLTMASGTGVITSTNGKIVGGSSSNLVLIAGPTGVTIPTITGGLLNLYSARTVTSSLSASLTITGMLTVAGTLNVGNNTLNYVPANYIGAPAQIATTESSRLELIGTGGVITIPGVGSPPRLLGSLMVTNTNDVILGSSMKITNDLDLINGVILLGNNNLSITGVVNGSFSSSAFISQNGTGRFNKTYTSLPSSVYFPIGTGSISASTNAFTPVEFTSLSATAPAEGRIAVTVNTAPPFPAYILNSTEVIKKYWSVTAPGLSNVVATFKTTFTGTDLADVGSESNYVTGYNISPSTTWSTGSPSEISSRVVSFNIGNTAGLTGNYTAGLKSGFIAVSLYSYQNGTWNNPNTWTEDPSGTTLLNPQVPGNNAEINILNGRTVSLTNHVTTTGHNIIINSGGTLDLSTFSITSLPGLSGQGLIRLNSVNFPTVGNNGLITANGGTVEYYNTSGVLPTGVQTYNNLWLTKDNGSSDEFTYQLGHNITTNGDLRIRNLLGVGVSALTIGTSATARTITVRGNLINGDAANPKTAAVISVNGFNAQHTLNLNGDFRNYGTVDFSNGLQYDASAATQSIVLNFLNSTNNEFVVDGPTEVFNVVVNKGTDQTYQLHLFATQNGFFRFMSDGNGFPITKGTLRLGNNIILDRLRNTGNYDIGTATNSGCQLWIDGAIIKVTSAGTGAGSRALVVYGKIKITSGEVTIVGAGLVPRYDGEIEIAGGKVDAAKYRPSVVVGVNPRGAFKMSGGVLELNRPGLPDIEGFVHAPFTMPFPEQVFNMSGGTINIYRYGQNTNTSRAFLIINSEPSNQVVTGGTINVTIAANNTHVIASRAPIYNLNVYKAVTGTAGILRLQSMDLDTEYQTAEFPNIPAYPLVVINNMYMDGLNAPRFELGDADFEIRKDINFTAGSIFTPAIRTTSIKGNVAQNVQIDGNVDAPFGNLIIENSNQSNVNLLGGLSVISVTNLELRSGVLDDGSKQILVSNTLINNSTHTGNGRIELIGTSPQTIQSNGNGTFGNLFLNNTSGTAGTNAVALQGKIVISKQLNLISDRVFNIQSSEVRLPGQSIITTTGNSFSVQKMLRTDGNQSDGGLSRFAFNNATTLYYPVGTDNIFAPVSATLSGISSTLNQGFIQISPTPAVLSTLSVTGVPNSALLYYWRTRSFGFVSAPQVSYTFNANIGSMWPSGIVGNPNNFVGGRVELPNRIPEATTILSDGLIHIAPHNIPSDASYTAAHPSRFNGNVRVFYNLNNGGGMEEIFTDGVFSLLCHTCAGTNENPGVGDILRLTTFTNTNQDHWVRVNRDLTVAGVIFENRNLGGWEARLTIEPDQNVDLGFVSGNGAIMVRTDGTPSVIPNLGGDFGDFAANTNSIFNYAFSANTGNVFLPSQPNIYPSIRFETGNNTSRTFTLPSVPLQINGNMSIGDGATVYTSTASGANVNIVGDLRIGVTGGQQGVLWLNDVGFPKTITVNRDIIINNTNASNTISVQNTNANNLMHKIQLGRNLLKSVGTFDLDNGAGVNANHAELEFIGTNNGVVNVTGGPTIELRRIIVNKGTNQTPRIVFASGFITSNLSNTSSKLVQFINGTLVFSTPGINVSLSSISGNVLIPSTSALVVANGSIVSMSSTTGLLLDGLLAVNQGGSAIFSDGINGAFIEYSASNNARIEVSGNGNLVVGSQIRRNTSSTAGTLQYYQTGGNVSILGIGAVTSNAKLEIDNPGSGFTMTGGNLIIQRGGGTTYGDLYINPGTSLVTGGNIILSPLVDIGSQSYRIVSNPYLYNLQLQGVGASSATGVVFVFPLKTNNNLVIGDLAVLNTNTFDVDIKGNTTFTGNLIPSTGTISFSGTALQNLRLNRAISFNNVVINTNANLSLSGLNPTVLNSLSTHSNSILQDGGTQVFLPNLLVHNGSHTGSGGLVFNGSSAQNISGNGVFNNIVIQNPSGISLLGNFTIQGNTNFENGGLFIGANRLTLGTNSSFTSITGTKFIRTNGVASDNGVVQNIPATSFDVTIPLGVFGKYTPVRYIGVGNSTTGTIEVKPVNEAHPLATDPGNYQLNYYWVVNNTGLNASTYTHFYTYDPADLNGNTSIYKVGRTIFGDWAPYYGGFSDSISGINLSTSTISLTGVDFLFGEYTAGEPSELQQVLTYYSRDATLGGNWDDINSWSTDPINKHAGAPVVSGLPPYGQPIVIKNGHTISTNGNLRQAYSTSIAGVINLGTSIGHNFGIIKGSGKMTISANPSLSYVLPAGQFSAFVSSTSGGTLEFTSNFDGDLPAISVPNLPNFNNVILSGVGKKKISSSTPNVLITGNLSILGGQLENTANNNIILKGNWINTIGIDGFNRGFISGSYVELSGGNQIVSGLNVFGGLRILNGGAKTFINNTTVNGTLQLTDGLINLGTNTLSIETNDGNITGGGAISYIVGNLQRQFNTGSNVSINYPIGDGGYSPISITYPSVTTGGRLIIRSIATVHPNLSTSCLSTVRRVNRYWQITEGSPAILPAVYNVTPTFQNPLDLSAGANTSLFIGGIYTGSVWSLTGVGTRTSTSTQLTSISNYGGLAIAEPNASVGITILGPAMPVCNPSTLLFTALGINGGTSPGFNWFRISSGVTYPGQSFASTYNGSTLLGGDLVRASLTSSESICTFNNPAFSNTIAVSFGTNGAWTGTENNLWTNGNNWCGGFPPGPGTDVSINTSPNYPLLSINGHVGSFSISSSASFTFTGSVFTIAGNMQNDGNIIIGSSSAVLYKSNSAQNIEGTSPVTYPTLAFAGSGTKTLNGPQRVSGVLSIVGNNVTLNANGNLRLLSTGTATGMTARVAPITSGSVISGNVTVERYITGKKANRFLSSPVTGGVVNQWQASTYITGPSGCIGCDASLTRVRSVQYYNEPFAGPQSAGWIVVTNVGHSLVVGRGYQVFIRGDRSVVTNVDDISATNPSITTPVRLALTGSLNIGDINVPITNTTSSFGTTADGWNLVGNPYASNISFDLLTATSVNLSNQMHIWDPNMAGVGAYYAYVGGVASDLRTNGGIIPSGGAFFVKPTASSGSVNFRETHKTTLNPQKANLRQEQISDLFGLSLTNLAGGQSDFTAIRFAADATTMYDEGYDADKFIHGTVLLASFDGAFKPMAVQTRSPYSPDGKQTIALQTQFSTNGAYKLTFRNYSSKVFIEKLQLVDSYTNDTIAVSGDTFEYSFTTSTDEKSRSVLRFAVLVNGQVSPIQSNLESNNSTLTGIQAPVQQIVQESNLSGVSSVNEISNSAPKVYPNPFEKGTLHVIIPELKNQSCTITFVNQVGKVVLTEGALFHNGSYTMSNLDNLPAGVYLIQVTNGKDSSLLIKWIKQ